jgi:methionine aminopeptidase, type I (EC 3.4.11.18)
MPRDDQTGFLTLGVVSKTLEVPKHIVRPEYVGNPAPAEWLGGHTKTPEQVEKIRAAGKIAARAIALAGESAKPGITTDELDRIAHEYMISEGAYPSTLGYRGFPKSCCTSLNEIICHGIPDNTVLKDGDILNVDITAYKDGFHGDTNATFLIGDVAEEVVLLVDRTRQSLDRAIAAVMPGRPINVIGRTIESYAKRFNYGVVRDFTGHGIGEAFHSGLVIPHFDAAPNYSNTMEVGMVFTIEPMLTLGTYEWDLWKDNWTVTTKDKSITAQFEHTLVVTESGAEILTLP